MKYYLMQKKLKIYCTKHKLSKNENAGEIRGENLSVKKGHTKYLTYLQNQEDPGFLKITPLYPAESEQLKNQCITNYVQCVS